MARTRGVVGSRACDAPPITITCDCGSPSSVAYGETLDVRDVRQDVGHEPDSRGRDYEALVAGVRRYRLLVVGPPLVLAAILIPLAVVVGIQYAFLLFVLVMAYGLLVVPQIRRRSAAQMSAERRRAGSSARNSACSGPGAPERPRISRAVTGSRPVMLVTFDVPFEPEATALAVDAAVESGQRLIVVNAVEVALGAASRSR